MEVARSKVENSPGISGSDDNPGPFDKLYKIKTDFDSAFFKSVNSQTCLQ